ncbi:protein kinase C delta type [Mycetomoellerius zeteki]|uniref:protein kinase C delta type n=1 Tax=Mycetomoellerius zeteki TaxID=64791 RepID=UPI00084E5283|nr:PREDICTED: protein kinase C delta type-like [Trachymyrmex zeteki]
MLKGSLSPYLDTHNEEESSYVTLSNGPYAYVADSTSTEHNSYNHVLIDVYFVTPILCKHCEDYIWGTGKVGVKCKEAIPSTSCSSSIRHDHRVARSFLVLRETAAIPKSFRHRRSMRNT